MKTTNYYLGISITGLIAILVCSCKTGTPGEAVRAAMETEIVKEKAEEYIEELNVPAVVVEEFTKNQSDTVERQWLVYKETPGEEINIELPEVYIVTYRKNAQDCRARYSKEGNIIAMNHLVDLSVLPHRALDLLQKGAYKEWEVVGDVFETLDNITNEPVGFIAKVKKAEEKERLFFDPEGNVVKIQKLTR
jgi:hypothetical protein